MKRFLISFTLIVLLAISSFAANIAGRVVNQAGRPVPARLCLAQVDRQGLELREINTIVDETGLFSFANLRPGNYVISAANREFGFGIVRFTIRQADQRIRIVLRRPMGGDRE